MIWRGEKDFSILWKMQNQKKHNGSANHRELEGKVGIITTKSTNKESIIVKLFKKITN